MPDYEKYGFKNTVIDRLANRPVFNANKMSGNSEQKSKIKKYAKTLNVPEKQTRTNLGDNSAITYAAGAVGGGVKALVKAAAKKLAKKGVIKGASS
ncbi:MAG: hypothetical protein ACR2M9_03735 [Cyanophyceae cyanobacterium]